MITVQAITSAGPFTAGSTYIADVRADGSYDVQHSDAPSGPRHGAGSVTRFNEPEFKRQFKLVGVDRSPAGHRAYASAQVESRARRVVSTLIEGDDGRKLRHGAPD